VWTPFITEPWRRCGIVVVLLVCGAVVTGCGHDQPAEDDVGAAATIGTLHYRCTVYALSAPTGLPDGVSTEDALDKIRSEAAAQGTLVGLYTRTSS
jgi:hypothetical protein